MQPPSPASATRRREPLLDLWRGFALLDMAWVHLASYPIGMPDGPADWIGEYTRWAAGGFVLLSGLTVRRVFGPGLAAGGGARQAVVHRLLRRSLLLAVVGRLACVAYTIVEGVMIALSGGDPPEAAKLLEMATFQRGGVTGGLLLLYSFLLALTPLVDRIRRTIGGAATFAISLGLYAAAHAAGDAANWPPWNFPLIQWQPLFFGGYLASMQIDRLRDAQGRMSARWLAASAVTLAAMFFVRSGVYLGVDPAWLPGWDFTKVPLQPAELAWYSIASVTVMVWSARLYEAGAVTRAASAWVLRLGRWSLLIYVSHLLLEIPIITFVTIVDPSPWMRAGTLVVMAVAMDATARAAEMVVARRAVPQAVRAPIGSRRRWLPDRMLPLLPPAGAVGTAVAVSCAASVLLFHAALAERPATVAPAALEEVPAVASGVSAEVLPADLLLPLPPPGQISADLPFLPEDPVPTAQRLPPARD